MIPRGSVLRVSGASALLAVSLLLSIPSSATTPVVNTLTLSLPGPFNACSVLDPGANATTSAILDLVRPSAFLTTSGDNLVGEGGAIASAELTSLKPETIQYTIAPNEFWSDGQIFNASSLINWWHLERHLASVQSDGYRDIASLVSSNDGLSVTAVFATPYAEWNLLFRDVEAPGAPLGCTWTDLSRRPSLGPYSIVSASPSKFLLVSNPLWSADPTRFARVVITDTTSIPSSPASYYVSYSLNVTRQAVDAVSSHPDVLSHIGTSSDLLEMTFSPLGQLTKSLRIREALSLILNRQLLIDDIFGSVTFSPSPAQSALYSQGQAAYPGGSGNGPSAQSTTTTLTPNTTSAQLEDCRACAVALLRKAKYVFADRHWLAPSGSSLTIHVAVGPTALDRVVANEIEHQWRSDGITVVQTNVVSDEAAANAAALNEADVAIFTHPTSTTAALTARSFVGPAYLDTYPSGVRRVALERLYETGIGIFNPVTAESTWLDLDQDVMSAFWVRPLFTTPSLVEWSNDLNDVYGSLSIAGIADQVMNWTIGDSNPQGT